MARKSNKTSHVLHLLAGEEPVPEATPETTEAKEETAELQAPVAEQESEPDTPNISIVSTRNSEDDPLADLIKEQLEEDFPEEILNTSSAKESGEPEFASASAPPETDSDGTAAGDVPPAETDNTEKVTEPEEENASPGTEDMQAEPADSSDAEPVEAETAEEPKGHSDAEEATLPKDSAETAETPSSPPDSGAAQPSPSAAGAESTTHYRFVNVMEYIIKDSVLEQMKKFDMCTCERCRVDTTALALTGCPAKYIVVDNHTVSPLLNFYSNKYMSTVTVELIKACTIVKENPRH